MKGAPPLPIRNDRRSAAAVRAKYCDRDEAGVSAEDPSDLQLARTRSAHQVPRFEEKQHGSHVAIRLLLSNATEDSRGTSRASSSVRVQTA